MTYSPSQDPPFWLQALLLLLAFIFPFVCAEIYFRVRYPSSVVLTGHVPDDEIGWDNSPPVSPRRNTGAREKVFFLGDSNVDGKLWMKFAQQDAAKQGVIFDGFSIGVSGHGTTQQLLKLRRYFDEYRPDVVVLLFTSWNDLRDNVRTPGVYYNPALITRPYYVRSGSGFVLWNHPPSLLGQLLAKSEVYVRILQRSGLRTVAAIAKNHMGLITGWGLPLRMYYDDPVAWEPFYNPAEQDNPYVTLAYDTTEYNLKLLKEYVEGHGSRLIALALDNAFTVDPDVFEKYVHDPAHFDAALPLKRSARMFRTLQITFTDPLDALRARQKELGTELFDGGAGNIGGHLLPEGEKVLASVAVPEIVKALRE